MLQVAGPFASPAEAFAAAVATGPGDLLGDFVLPPAGGPPTRSFQMLHVDFGLPLRPAAPRDIARWTALHIPADTAPSGAATRFVPLAAVLSRSPADVVERFERYGRTHGAFDDDADGYTEGSLARLVDALEPAPALPSVKEDANFLCGTEFASLAEEVAFFAARDIELDALTVEVVVQPGELLLFENLRLAHGRRGTRQPGELRQWVFGTAGASVEEQLVVRDEVLRPSVTPEAAWA